MFLLNSRLRLFTAATFLWHPFSRSYGVILPSSLTRVLPFVLGFSPHLPVSVCGTGAHSLNSSFSRQCEITRFLTYISFPITHQPWFAYFTTNQPLCLDRVDHHPARVILLCHCLSQTIMSGTGISTCCPSPTTSVLGLGPDLPWADEPSPGNLGLSTAVFLALLSLLIPAFSLLYSPPVLPLWLQPVHYAPLPLH